MFHHQIDENYEEKMVEWKMSNKDLEKKNEYSDQYFFFKLTSQSMW
jgi:hypothetical protein